MAVAHHPQLGRRAGMSRGIKQQGDDVGAALPAGHVRGRPVPGDRGAAVRLVPQRRDGQADYVDVCVPELLWHLGVVVGVWDFLYEWDVRHECVAMVRNSSSSFYIPLHLIMNVMSILTNNTGW